MSNNHNREDDDCNSNVVVEGGGREGIVMVLRVEVIRIRYQ